MDKVNKWVSKHKIIAFVLYNLICWVPFLVLALTVEIRLIWWIVFGMLVLFASAMFVTSIERHILNKAVKLQNEQCDPNPFLEIIERQLSIVKSKSYQQLLLINKAAALRDLGRFDEVFSILSSINIDQYNTTLPLTKIVYYNNLTDILIINGEYFQANIWHSKMMQMISDLKANEKQKKQLNEIPVLNQAELFIAGNNFSEAERLINGLPESISNRQRISKCLIYAKLLIKQNRKDEAEEYLQFVIDYGNKLYDATEAKQMLEQMGKDGNRESTIF